MSTPERDPAHASLQDSKQIITHLMKFLGDVLTLIEEMRDRCGDDPANLAVIGPFVAAMNDRVGKLSADIDVELLAGRFGRGEPDEGASPISGHAEDGPDPSE